MHKIPYTMGRRGSWWIDSKLFTARFCAQAYTLWSTKEMRSAEKILKKQCSYGSMCSREDYTFCCCWMGYHLLGRLSLLWSLILSTVDWTWASWTLGDCSTAELCLLPLSTYFEIVSLCVAGRHWALSVLQEGFELSVLLPGPPK